MLGLVAAGAVLAGPAAEAHAQEAPVGSAPVAAPQLHDELRSLAATMEKALNSGDIDTIASRVTNDVVFTTMNGDVVRGRDGVRAYFAKMMEGPDRIVETVTSHFTPDDLSILLDDHTAVAFGSSADHYVLRSGPAMDITARWSGTMVHRGGGGGNEGLPPQSGTGRWYVASFHYSANVFDNPILAAQRRVLLLALAGVAVVVGVIGFLLGRRAGRRSAA